MFILWTKKQFVEALGSDRTLLATMNIFAGCCYYRFWFPALNLNDLKRCPHMRSCNIQCRLLGSNWNLAEDHVTANLTRFFPHRLSHPS